MINKNKIRVIIYLSATTATLFLFQNCAKVNFETSYQEQQAIKSDVFPNQISSADLIDNVINGTTVPNNPVVAPVDPVIVDVPKFDPNDYVAGINNDGGIPLVRPTYKESGLIANREFITDCSEEGRYAKEKAAAIAAAKADTSGKTIPVVYSFSVGYATDVPANFAHQRAVLSKDRGVFGTGSIIPVGAVNIHANQARNHYYKVNHDNAKNDFIKGKSCFFSTVRADELVRTQEYYYDFLDKDNDFSQRKHTLQSMLYGNCTSGTQCTGGNNFSGEYANRLFKNIEGKAPSNPQIVKLYMADLRANHFGYDNILKISEITKRGEEQLVKIKEIVNICELSANIKPIVANLSESFEENNITFSGMDGMSQFINNLSHLDIIGTNLPSQYTPIVLDLGEQKVRTTSIRWGTFFNMANLKEETIMTSEASEENKDTMRNVAAMNNTPFSSQHRTAWLGGDFVNYFESNDKFNYQRQIEDGFLVRANHNGEVLSSEDMFGDNTIVNGMTYENGFIALQKLSNKDCTSEDLTKRYFGPWDGDLYDTTVKVWVDANGNGRTEPTEIKTLKESGVVAINTCNIVHNEVSDSFGNGTQLRSSFLIQKNKDITSDTEEILYQLKNGKSTAGETQEFRLAIDIIFKVNEDLFCEG